MYPTFEMCTIKNKHANCYNEVNDSQAWCADWFNIPAGAAFLGLPPTMVMGYSGGSGATSGTGNMAMSMSMDSKSIRSKSSESSLILRKVGLASAQFPLRITFAIVSTRQLSLFDLLCGTCAPIKTSNACAIRLCLQA